MGAITPLGTSPSQVLRRIEAGDSAASPPAHFDASPFTCPVCAPIADFDIEKYVSASKTVRLMSREAQLAVAAARLALSDAGVRPGVEYPPEDMGLFGATGLAGLPLGEVTPLIQHSAGPDGVFDPARFGSEALRRVRPVLSFKILSNMPICFVSMFENLQGANAVYSPWEGQGAQAIAQGIRAVVRGDASCAVVGGCDFKTHELAFVALQQHGVFRSWKAEGQGCVPAEGAAFLLLESQEAAVARGARIYARIGEVRALSTAEEERRSETYEALLSRLSPRPDVVVSAGDRDERLRHAEERAIERAGLRPHVTLTPKAFLGNLFAAAAAVQVAIAALLAERARTVLANCFGYGRMQTVFLLEKP